MNDLVLVLRSRLLLHRVEDGRTFYKTDEVGRAAAREIERLREALQFYATASGYDIDIDCGDKARRALKGDLK